MNNSTHTPMRSISSGLGKQAGLSLIELMIASVIGLVLLSGVVTIFSSNSASSKLSTGMGRVQDNGRVALDIFSYSLRMTGYEGCRDEAKEPIVVLASSAPRIQFPDNAIWGASVNDARTWSPPVLTDLVEIENNDWAKPGTDVLYVQHGGGRSEILANDMSGSGSNIELPGNPDQLRNGDLLMISDCTVSNVFRATGINVEGNSGKTTIQHDANANLDGNLSHAYTGSTSENQDPVRVMRFESQAYFVADSGRTMPNDDPIFSLYSLDTSTTPVSEQTRTELIEGVEHMEVLYGQNMTPDADTADIRYMSAESVSNWADIVSVQIGLLIATADYSAQSNDTSTYNVAGTMIGPATTVSHPGDRRTRAAFNTTIQLRNRNL